MYYGTFGAVITLSAAHIVLATCVSFVSGIWFAYEQKMVFSIGKFLSVVLLGATILSLTSHTILIPVLFMLYVFAMGLYGGAGMFRLQTEQQSNSNGTATGANPEN